MAMVNPEPESRRQSAADLARAHGRPSLRHEGRQLALDYGDGIAFTLHPLWLRERTQEKSAFDPVSRQRLFEPAGLDLDVAIDDITRSAAGRITILFSDGHAATFDPDRLIDEAALDRSNDGLPAIVHWDRATEQQPPVAFCDLDEDAGLLEAVTCFLQYGFVLIGDAPVAPGTLKTIAEKFGVIRRTNFGELFEIRTEPAAEDLAYTAQSLPPHTDNPYRRPVPGIQLLHALVNTADGGLSTLVDGAYVVEALRQSAPEAFDILARTPVRFRYEGPGAILEDWAAMIELDSAGGFRSIRFSSRVDYVPALPPGELDRYFAARQHFSRMLNDARFRHVFRLEAGMAVMFDNARLLHGRTAFDPASGARHYQGCYIDHDGPHSLFRRLGGAAGRTSP